MRVILGTGRGALAFFFASHEFSFKVPSNCHMMVAHRVLATLASLRSAPLMFGSALGAKGSLRVPWVLIFVDGSGHLYVE
jgi:hypothetical protein